MTSGNGEVEFGRRIKSNDGVELETRCTTMSLAIAAGNTDSGSQVITRGQKPVELGETGKVMVLVT